MPYRNVPARDRPWFEAATAAWFAGFIAQGIAGFIAPSPSMSTALGAGQVVYSAGIILVGALGLAAWWRGRRGPELKAMYTLAAMTLAHGLGLIVTLGGDGAQTGIRVAAAAVGTAAWTGLRTEFGISRTHIEEAIEHMETPTDGRKSG